MSARLWRVSVVFVAPFALALLLPLIRAAPAAAACSTPVTIACENSLPGDPPSDWQVSGAGDSTIQGYATQAGVNVGQTVSFKIDTPSTAYHIDILRLGYYQGNGARLIASNIKPSATLPQTQPPCQTFSSTGLIDCGNWGVSASWTVPTDAVSGVYIAHLVRDDSADPGGESQIMFVVRNDASHSDVLVQTSDETWQAYNDYGGNSLYTCTVACPTGNPGGYKAAYAVSYNRPFDGTFQTDGGDSNFFYAEYQMVRFLEENGYDVSYTNEANVDQNGALLQNHKAFISSAHDEYWSANQRANVTAARDAGVNLAFFSGNEVYWKTRWANSSDSSNTPYRTLITYKETHEIDSPSGENVAPTDPDDPPTWTGTWADPRLSPPADGGQPQNALTGQFFNVNSGTSDITVPSQYSKLRVWRNTAVASLGSGQSVTLGAGQGTLGYEWDVDPDDGFRPAGLFDLSSTTPNIAGEQDFTDYGTSVNSNGTDTHHLTLYRAPSGARVFGAGTVQWSWGLDNTNALGNAANFAIIDKTDALGNPTNFTSPLTKVVEGEIEIAGGAKTGSTTPASAFVPVGAPASAFVPSNPPDVNMQQATVNLLADMGAQPATLLTGLKAASPSTDTTPPTSTISSPAVGANISDGSSVTITGTATDGGGGVVAGVEVSTDGGTTWHPAGIGAAAGNVNWSYTWIAHGSPTTTIRSRAVDDSGNVETPSGGVKVNVNCSCSLWGSLTPPTPDSGDASSIEVGVKFKSDVAGNITGIRFYKSTANTGTHIGNLWSASGTPLASATFTGESASGWQTVSFASPVAITANTTYVASYFAPNGHYASSTGYFYPPPSPEPLGGGSVDSPPLHALRQSTNPPTAQTNGVFAYNASSTFPTSTFQAENYWVDVNFVPTTTTPTVPAAPTNVTATAGNGSATVSWTAPSDGGSPITSYTVTPFIGSTAQTPTTVTGSPPATTANITGLTNGTSYTFKVTATNSVGTGPLSVASNSVTPSATTVDTIFGLATPPVVDSGDPNAVELGVQFQSSVPGMVTGIRFYKATTNTGTHIGGLWTASGTLLTSATFTGESASGWQTVSFPNPVAISANTTYVAGYFAPNGHYSDQEPGFTVGVSNPPLQALANNSVTPGNGLYAYTSTSTFPNSTFNATNYYVDVTFTPTATTAPAAPTNVTATAGNGSATVSWTAPSDGGSPITSYTVTPFIGSTAQTPTTITGSPPATSANITGLTNGTSYTFKVTATNAIGTSPPSTASTSVTPSAPTVPAAPTNVTATAGNGSATVSWTAPSDGGSPITSYTVTPFIGSTAQTPTTVTGSPPATTANITGLTNGTSYTFKVTATNSVGTGPLSVASNSVTPSATTVDTIFGLATPPVVDSGDPNAVELGVQFQSSVPGMVTGIRFYKATTNTGTHIGGLWTASGTLLTSATFTGESASGWQTVSFPNPVAISANTTYVAGYFAPNGHYSDQEPGFTVGVSNPPLQALANNSVTPGNGLYAYTSTSTFPNSTFNAANYYVDVTFTPTATTAPAAPTNVTATAGNGSATVSWTAPSNGGSPITSYTVTPFIGSTAQTPTTITGSPPATSANITGLTNGTSYTFKVTATNAIGTSPPSTASNAVTPTAATVTPAFVQQVSSHATNVTSGTVMPTSNISVGNRLVVLVGVWNSSGATAKSVTDSAGNSYTEVLHFKASDQTEESVWTAPITAGGGTKPTITVTPTSTADVGVAALEYSGLSAASGTGTVDQTSQGTGTTGSAATVSSGATSATTGSNELALGFYVDSGFGDTLTAGNLFSARTNVSNTSDMELLAEDQFPAQGATPNASAGTGANTVWLMSTVVFKHG